MTETAAISESYLPSRAERAARLVQLWFVGIVAGLRFIILAMISAAFVTFLVGLRVLGEADFGLTDSPGWVFKGFGVILAIAAVIGSLIAMRRLPRRRRSYASAAISRAGDDTATAEEHRYLDGICSALGIAAGIEPPVVRVVASPACNAMAVSQGRGEATLVLTRGLLATGRRPVEAVIAYEMTLMARGEVSLVTWVLALTGAEGTKGESTDSVTAAAGTGRVGRWLRSWALAGFARRRDVAALSMTRDPQSLAAALRAVADDTGVPATLCADDAPLWLEYPGQDADEFRTRIAALERGGGRP